MKATDAYDLLELNYRGIFAIWCRSFCRGHKGSSSYKFQCCDRRQNVIL